MKQTKELIENLEGRVEQLESALSRAHSSLGQVGENLWLYGQPAVAEGISKIQKEIREVIYHD